jgi:hypothetical protein
VTERLHVSLEFEAACDPIAGTMTVGGAQRPFTGWLGLIAALEAAIAGRDGASVASGVAITPPVISEGSGE